MLRLKERGYLPMSGVHILSATVSEKAGRWFVSLQVEMDIPEPEPKSRLPGWIWDQSHGPGQRWDLFRESAGLESAPDKMKRLQRVVSRRQKGSANRKKAVRQLARAHYRVANIRKDALHQATSFWRKPSQRLCWKT